jgi:hypothetical protein
VPPHTSKAQIAAADNAFADLATTQGSGVAFPAFAADEAVEIGGGMVYGKDQVAAAHAGGGTALDWWPSDVGASFSGDLGYSFGPYIYTDVAPDGTVSEYHGKYLSVWRKYDGAWKWLVDGGNSNPPPPAQ